MTPSSNISNEAFGQRLRLWRASQNFTQSQAAERLDIDRAYLSQIERGRPPGNALRTRFYLVEQSSNLRSITTGPSRNLRNIPVVSWTQAGVYVNVTEMPATWDEVVPSDVPDERAYGVRLRGDSMEPRFSDGDIAILLPSSAPLNGETVIANLKGQGVFCKILHAQPEKNLLKLSSYNPAYPTMEYHTDEFHWIYPVSHIVKELRRS
jgi:SOS-response transcriptional repressor LexA